MRGASEIRNRVLARVLLEAKLVETWGRGITRMLELCRQAGLPEPVIRENGLFVQTTLFRPVPGNLQEQPAQRPSGIVPDQVLSTADLLQSAGIVTRLMPEYLAIISHLQNNPSLSRKQLSELTAISDSGIKRRLEKLVLIGILERIGPDKGGAWRIISQPTDPARHPAG